MGIKIVSVAEATGDAGIKILVHAPAGTGKTVMAATAMEKTLIISAEAGLLSLNNEELKKENPHFSPELCDVVVVKQIDDLEEIYVMLMDQKNDRQWEWVCLDSITEIAEVVLSDELDLAKDPRKAYGELYNRVNKILRSYRDLPGYNVYMSCKQTPVKDDFSGLTLYSPMMPGAKLGNAIPYLFDEVLALRVMQDEDGGDFRCLQTSRCVQYEAKDRSGKLEKYEAPSLKRIADKINGNFVDAEAEVTEEDAVEEKGIAVEVEFPTYFYHAESDAALEVLDIVNYQKSFDAGLEEISKSKYDEIISSQNEKKISEQKDESKNKSSLAENLKELDKQDLIALALALDEEIENDVAKDSDIETLIEWITESDVGEIKEAAKNIGIS